MSRSLFRGITTSYCPPFCPMGAFFFVVFFVFFLLSKILIFAQKLSFLTVTRVLDKRLLTGPEPAPIMSATNSSI